MRLHSHLFAAALLIFHVAGETRAQSPGQDAPQTAQNTAKIATIAVTGTQRFPSDQVVAASGLKPGDTVSTGQLQAAADRLAALGIFSSVNYRFSSKGETISLEFQVQDAPAFPLSFDNFPWLSDEEISQAVRQQVGLFTGVAPESGAMLDEISVVIERLLAAKKVRGNVTHQLLGQASGEGMMMQFRVDVSGLRIQSVQFGDSLATDSNRLKGRIPDLKGQPYSRFAIEVFENEHLRPLYASRGYLRAKIGPPQPKLTIDASYPTETGVDVSIPITPGSVYTWNGISWQGNTAITSANLDKAVQIKTGDPVDGMKVEAMWQTIESAYGSHGYLDAKLDPRPSFDDTSHKVSYNVTIAEGAPYRMGQLVVTGLSLDAERRLRNVWLIPKGQFFDSTYFERMTKELATPSADIFGEMPVHYAQFGNWLRPDTEKHTVDVLLDFK